MSIRFAQADLRNPPEPRSPPPGSRPAKSA